jgi:hypothetical protein
MTDHGVSDSDMHDFPGQIGPEVQVLDALLSRNCRPEEAPAGLRPVAEALLALQAPADQRELAGWEQVLIAYRAVAGGPGTSGRPRSRRPRLIAAPLGARVASAAGVAVIAVLSGGIAAAYTGSLPVALQKIAHDTIAAPGVRESRAASAPGRPGHPVGPSATGSAAFGLCNAYQHGNASQRAVSFRNLVSTAGGAAKVASFCAQVQHPGAANLPGRQAGHSGPSAAASHRGKPTAGPGNGNGGGNGHGKKS